MVRQSLPDIELIVLSRQCLLKVVSLVIVGSTGLGPLVSLSYNAEENVVTMILGTFDFF